MPSKKAGTTTRYGRARDTQRQRIYDAGECWKGESRAAARLLGPAGPKVPSTGNVTTEACQEYVDEVCGARWFQSRWGKRRIPVTFKAWGDATGGHLGGGDISLPPWARSEGTILHELAHCLTPHKYAPHGPEFAGILLTLVRYQVGAEAARQHRQRYREHRVRWSMAAVPEVDVRMVASKSAAQERARAAAAKPPNRADLEEAAAVIRRAARAGLLGAAERKPRQHAMDTARLLERCTKP